MFRSYLKNSISNLQPGIIQQRSFGSVTLHAGENQVLGLAQYAKGFMAMDNGKIADEVYDRVRLFHTDASICGASAIAQKCSAPTVLRNEAKIKYSLNPDTKKNMYWSRCIGTKIWSHSEKAICANVSAVREWDSNGTVFGYNPLRRNAQAGEFGHNDYYPVVIAACHNNSQYSGEDALKGMILLDEIRGRLCEVFSLKSYKIDHVVHGAIASAVVYGTMLGASSDQIESAVGMVVSHYIPFRAIRSGHQLSDSKGASAALTTEVAIQSVHRAMDGFQGPKDIFRNYDAIFRKFEPCDGDNSPFDLNLTTSGDDFAIMDMHFKLGLYEHQSASAIGAIIKMLTQDPEALLSKSGSSHIDQVEIKIYEPAFGIIGDKAKREPTCRQSADHSMVYIIGTLLRKAFEKRDKLLALQGDSNMEVEIWKHLLLQPKDYTQAAIYNEETRAIMDKIVFEHGGDEYDELYPEGIPTSVMMKTKHKTVDSGIVQFPQGHSQCQEDGLSEILMHKFKVLGKMAMDQESLAHWVDALENIQDMTNQDLHDIYDCNLKPADESIDAELYQSVDSEVEP